jgi:hypothetical protein
MRNWVDLSKKEQIERWEQAARVLKGLSRHERRKHFNMSFWGEKTDCGTVACAAGHCGLDSWFRRRGFKLDFVYEHDGHYDPKTDGFGPGWDARISRAEDFFGIEGTEDIFHNGDERSVGTVIREIQAYIKILKARK